MTNKIPPYDYHVWFKGSKKPIHMTGMHEDHIRWQCENKVPIKIKRITTKEESIGRIEHLGPKGSVVNSPADYDAGFKILKEWVDTEGGPPEHIRKKLRELYIYYDVVKKNRQYRPHPQSLYILVKKTKQ